MDENDEDRARVKRRQDQVNRLVAVLIEIDPHDRGLVIEAARHITSDDAYGFIGPGRAILHPVRPRG